MSEAKLPEELIREIIRLCIPPFCPKAFLKFPVGRTSQQRSSERAEMAGILLVSRRWLRIGTPMFYKGVVLWTSRQTSAVARLVATDPAVGRMIQYLRLESGSMTRPRDLAKLAENAPSIRTVYVEGDLCQDDSYDGLLRAVRYLRPTKLYIAVCPEVAWSAYGPTTRRRENLAVLSGIVGMWTSVTEIHFSDGEALGHMWQHCLHTLTSLREVHIPTPPDRSNSPLSPTVVTYAQSPAFKRVVFHGTEKRDYVTRCFEKAKGHGTEHANTLAWEDELD
ncbi:hypothetical protein PsYK624_079810 [Phanerochaete sordida]|uniref:Uncharacterized protein n=1 Tax=Phanerochaete sordida TaxID=48140 RepID=A0A9P3GDI6_9APHY|nr:hypothetical protein PsYK624_079810 [Phanerochaete sordida]